MFSHVYKPIVTKSQPIQELQCIYNKRKHARARFPLYYAMNSLHA